MKCLYVLVVHPDEGTCDRLARAIATAGHRAASVPDGERAIDSFVQEPADAVVLEMVLPGRDGPATIESLRWAPAGAQVPVILLGTDTSQAQVEATGRAVGAVAALSGPPDPPKITSVLENIRASLKNTSGADVSDAIPTSELSGPRHSVTRPSIRFSKPREVEPAASTSPHPDTDSLLRRVEPNASREGIAVERQAASLKQADALIRGTFIDNPFPRILSRLAKHRASGALVLDSPEDNRRTTTGESSKKIIFFRNGVPQHVWSNLETECLGQVLIERQLIGEGALAESLAHVREGAGRVGAVLMAMGALSPHELRDALEHQQRIKLFDVFRWTSGSYQFSDELPAPHETITLELSLVEIVYRGVVEHSRREQIAADLQPHQNEYVIPLPNQLVPFLRLQVSPEAKAIIRAIDGTKRLRELRAEFQSAETERVVFALQCADAVKFRRTPQKVDPYATPSTSEEEPTLSRIESELHRLDSLLEEGRFAEALGVPPGDARAAHSAIGTMERRLGPAMVRGATDRRTRTRATNILERLKHAGEVLSQTNIAEADEHTEPLPESVSTSPISTSPALTNPASTNPALTSPALTSPTLTSPALTNPVSTNPRSNPPTRQSADAEQFFRRGEQALHRGDPAAAAAAFYHAVELCPEEGEFLAYLGYARHAAAPDDSVSSEQAVVELRNGCRLAPKLDVAHLLLARVFVDRGELAHARNAFGRALAANPDCEEALIGLRSLEPKTEPPNRA